MHSEKPLREAWLCAEAQCGCTKAAHRLRAALPATLDERFGS